MSEISIPEVLIVGAGSIGQVYGYHLNKAGANVHFYVREHNKEKLTSNPLRIHRLSSVLRMLNKSTTESWTNYTVHTDTEVNEGVDTLPETLTYVIFAVPADKFNTGDWLEKLLNLTKKRPGKIMYITSLPDESCTVRLTSLGIEKSQIITTQIGMCSYFAPLANQCIEARGKEIAEKDSKDSNPNKVVVYSQVSNEFFGNLVEESNEQTKEFVELMNKGGFTAKKLDGDLKYGLYGMIFMPLLMALAISKWSFWSLATNFKLLVLANASISEDALIQSKRFKDFKNSYLFIYMPTFALSLSLMVMYALSKYICTFDIEAFCKVHFNDKLHTQTEYWAECIKKYSKEYDVDIRNFEELLDEYNKTPNKYD